MACPQGSNLTSTGSSHKKHSSTLEVTVTALDAFRTKIIMENEKLCLHNVNRMTSLCLCLTYIPDGGVGPSVDNEV